MATKTENRKVNVYINGELAKKNLKELREESRRLKNQLATLDPESQQFIRGTKNLNKVNKRLNTLNGKLRSTGGLFGTLKKEVKQFGVIALSYLGISAITSEIGGLIRKLGELDDQYGNVRKTTGLSRIGVAKLHMQFRKFDTRTATMELLKMAEAGGRLNVAKEDLADFVKYADIVNVALGDEFSGGAEQIATQLGKIRSLFKETKDLGIAEAFLQIGSSINALGSKTKATGGNIAEFTLRVGAMPEALKPTIQETMALAAFTEEAGISAEIASRGYSIFVRTAAENIGKFSRHMGIAREEAEAMINTDPVGFFEEFAKTLRGMPATEVAQSLKDLGVGAEGTLKVVGALSGNYERFNEILRDNIRDTAEATSVTEEFNIKNEGFAAKVQRIRKELYRLVSSGKIKEFIMSMVDGFGNILNVLKVLPQTIKENRGELALLAMALISLKWMSIVKGTSAFSESLRYQQTLLKMSVNQFGKTGTAINLVKGAWKSLGDAFRANPIGFVTTTLIVLIEAVKWYDKNNAESLRIEKEKKAALEKTQESLEILTKQYSDTAVAMADFSSMSAQQRSESIERIKTNIQEAKSILEVTKAKREQIFEDSKKATLWQRFRVATMGGGLDGTESQRMENATAATKDLDEQLSALEDSYGRLTQQATSFTATLLSEQHADNVIGSSVAAMESKLNLYQKALRLTTKGSEDYIRILKKIKSIQDNLKRSVDDSGGDADGKGGDKNGLIDWKAELEKSEEGLDKILKKIKDWEYQLEQSKKGSREQELDAIKKKYDDQLEEARTHAKNLAKLEEVDLLVKRGQELAGASTDEEREDIEAKYDAQLELYDKYHKTVDEIELLKEEELKAKKEEFTAEDEEKKQEALDKGIEWINALTNSKKSALDQELADQEVHFQEMLALYKKNGLDTTQIIDANDKAVAALHAKYAGDNVGIAKDAALAIANMTGSLMDFVADSQLDTANFGRAMALVEIGIETGKAIAGAVASATKVGNPFAMIGLIATSISTVLGAIKRAKAAISQDLMPAKPDNTPPKFSQGTILEGSSHSSGGNVIIDKTTGQVIGEAEAGELIGSASFVRQNPALAREILAAGKNDGVLRDNWFLDVPKYPRAGSISNYVQSRSSVPQFNQGTIIGEEASPDPVSNDTSNLAMVLAGITNAMTRLSNQLDRGTLAKLNDETVQDLFERKDELDVIRDDAGI